MAASQPEIYTIICLITGEDIPFSIEIANNETVHYLKEMIKQKKENTFGTIAANQLTLYSVEILSDELAKKLEEKCWKGQTPLSPMKKLAGLFGDGPKEDTLHIIVEPPTSAAQKRPRESSGDLIDEEEPDRPPRKRKSKTVVTAPEWCPRKDTVSGVLDLLHEHRLVQVRGTPASGKTTLMHLLHARIMEEHPKAKVYIHLGWPKATSQSMNANEHLSQMLPGYPSFDSGEQYFLFDEGQTTYWDAPLWVTFKDHIQARRHPVYAILFCVYGNDTFSGAEGSGEGGITLPHFGDANVTLDRVSKSGSEPYGLLLDEGEFRDVIERRAPRLLADDLRDFVYRFTRGHVGGTVAVIEFLLKKRKASMLTGTPYRLDDFHQDTLSYDEFCTHLSMDHGIARGLLDQKVIPTYGPAMRDLLLHESIDPYNQDIAEDTQSKLKKGYKRGLVNLDENFRYTFASPLHRQLWSWRLPPQADYQLPFEDLFSFVKATVARFRPSQLDESDRRVNSDRPAEAQYQDEFYRCVHNSTNGNVRITPEYVAAAGSPGRIDFFIPSKKWGIELTRDGIGLEEHNSRFAGDGAYEQWLRSSDMDDYILLDFRGSQPTKPHPTIRNLYHVVFSEDKTQLKISDNQLDSLDTQNLMQR